MTITQTTTVYAKVITGRAFNEKHIDAVNNGSAETDYYYLHSDGTLSVSNPYKNLSEAQQKECLLWIADNREIEFLIADSQKQFQSVSTIDIQAKEWHDKVNGNSYFSAVITLDFAQPTERVITVPFTYGYGNHYITESLHVLQTSGVLPEHTIYNLSEFCRENNIILRASIKRNCLKREVKALTQYV